MNTPVRATMLALIAAAVASFAIPSAAKEAKERVAGHLVIVWHVDARQLWIGRGGDAAQMQAVLLQHCTKTMASGCKVALSVSGGAVVFGQMANGIAVLMHSANSLEEAQTAMADECRKRATVCETLREFRAPWGNGKPSYEVPKNSPTLHRRYGAVVWQSPVTAPVRVWTATGRKTSELARSDALAKCRADTGGECVVAQYGSDSAMVIYTENSTGLAVAQERSPERAKQLVKEVCQRRNFSCKVQAVINTAAEGAAVHSIAP